MHIYHIRLLVYFWFTTMLIFATWCNWRDFYWCWIKFCLSLSLKTKSCCAAIFVVTGTIEWLSQRQPPVPSMTTKLASWQLFSRVQFQELCTCCILEMCNVSHKTSWGILSNVIWITKSYSKSRILRKNWRQVRQYTFTFNLVPADGPILY